LKLKTTKANILYWGNSKTQKLTRIIWEQTTAENKSSFLKLLENNSSAKVIDLGCGTGSFTKELGEQIGTSDLYGIDNYENDLEQALQKGIKICIADLNFPLPVDSETFDVVCASQVIEHLYNTDIFIKEIYRMLKHKGYAVLTTPNLAGLHNLLPLLLGFQPLSTDVSDEIWVGNRFSPYQGIRRRVKGFQYHLRIFTYSALKELFEYHGFRVEKLLSVGFYPFPIKIGKLLSYIDPSHAAYLTVKVRKI